MSRRIDGASAGLTIAIGSILGLFVLCACGCTDPATHQFAYSEPAVLVDHGVLSGTHIKVSSKFTGSVDVKRDPETGEVQELHAEVASDPVDVYAAQAARVTQNFLAGRQAEYGFKIEAAKVISAALVDVARAAMTMGLAIGGDAGSSIIGAAKQLFTAADGDPDLAEVVRLLKEIGAAVNANTNGV